MYEFLEKLFGKTEDGQPKALTFEEMKTALEADKTISVVNLKDGGYVSKEKFDAKETELKGVQKQLDDANEQIKSFQGEDVEGIKKKVDEWESKYKADTEDLKRQIEAQETRHQKDLFFADVKFASNAAKIGIMAEFDKQQFQLKDGTFQGAEAWLNAQKESDPASFVQETPPDDQQNQQNQQNQQQQQQAPQTPKPTFVTATSQGSGMSQEQLQPFNFGFRHVKPKPEQ